MDDLADIIANQETTSARRFGKERIGGKSVKNKADR